MIYEGPGALKPMDKEAADSTFWNISFSSFRILFAYLTAILPVSFNFSVNFQNNSKEIIFILNKGNDEKNQGLDDYSKILSNEIIKFRKVLDLLITSYNSNNKIITNNVNEINSLKEENKTIKNELNTLKQLITRQV